MYFFVGMCMCFRCAALMHVVAVVCLVEFTTQGLRSMRHLVYVVDANYGSGGTCVDVDACGRYFRASMMLTRSLAMLMVMFDAMQRWCGLTMHITVDWWTYLCMLIVLDCGNG